MQCGSLDRLAEAGLATVLRYARHAGCRSAAFDHAYPSHALVITGSGEWSYHGAHRAQTVDAREIVAGVGSGEYRCRHEAGVASTSLILALSSQALDGNDGTLFGRDVVPLYPEVRAHTRSILTALDDPVRLESLVFFVYDIVSRVSHGARQPNGHDLRMEYVKRVLSERYGSRLTLSMLAKEVGLSPFTLARRFRAHAGMSVHGYLMQVRIERAKRDLRCSTQPIEEIALHSGFNSFAHFSSSFHRLVGSTPTRFRLAIRS